MCATHLVCQGVWSQSTAHPVTHPSSSLTAARHRRERERERAERERERQDRYGLVHHYSKHWLIDQQGTWLSMPNAHEYRITVNRAQRGGGGGEREREREERELMYNILPNNRHQTPIVLVNPIQISSCLIHDLTLCGHPESQCMQLFQEGHCVGLCHPYNGAGWLTEAWCCWNKGFVSPELLSIRDQMCYCILGQNASMQMQIWMFGQHIKSTVPLGVLKEMKPHRKLILLL